MELCVVCEYQPPALGPITTRLGDGPICKYCLIHSAERPFMLVNARKAGRLPENYGKRIRVWHDPVVGYMSLKAYEKRITHQMLVPVKPPPDDDEEMLLSIKTRICDLRSQEDFESDVPEMKLYRSVFGRALDHLLLRGKKIRPFFGHHPE